MFFYLEVGVNRFTPTSNKRIIGYMIKRLLGDTDKITQHNKLKDTFLCLPGN